jgi:hypothetical protein
MVWIQKEKNICVNLRDLRENKTPASTGGLVSSRLIHHFVVSGTRHPASRLTNRMPGEDQ